jgi:hypothetical protein
MVEHFIFRSISNPIEFWVKLEIMGRIIIADFLIQIKYMHFNIKTAKPQYD